MGFEKFKNLFVVDVATSSTPTAQPTPVVTTVQPTVPTVVVATTPPAITIATTPDIVKNGVQINQKVLEMLCDVLDKADIPGPDYMELRNGAEKLEKYIQNPNDRFMAAYDTLKGNNKALTKSHVIGSIDVYINVVKDEETKGMKQLADKRKASVLDRQSGIESVNAEIVKMESQVQQLMELINAKRESISVVNTQIEAAKLNCDQQEADFLFTIKTVVDKLVEDKNKLEQILND